MLNHSNHKHYPIKATKLELLKYTKKLGKITPGDLVEHFGYKRKSAADTLYKLAREGLLIEWTLPGKWCLTQLGERRLKYYAGKERQ